MRPAIRALSEPQRRYLARFVAGFDSVDDVLSWGRGALVQTLGEFSVDDVASYVTDRGVLHVLVDGYPAPGDAPALEPGERTRIRVGIATLDYLPECRAARRRIRWDVKEWAPGEWNGGLPDGQNQRHPAMLPALTEVDERTKWGFDRFLDGFGSLPEFQVWHEEFTDSAFMTLDGTLVESAVLDETRLRDVLLIEPRDGPEDRQIRRAWALDDLLPAVADAADQRAIAAREHVEADAETDSDMVL